MGRKHTFKKTGPKSTLPSASTCTQIKQLTKRQQEVAFRIAVGRFTSEIADELEVSVKTIDTHRAVALSRLGLRNNVELALLAVRQGWVDGLGEITAS